MLQSRWVWRRQWHTTWVVGEMMEGRLLAAHWWGDAWIQFPFSNHLKVSLLGDLHFKDMKCIVCFLLYPYHWSQDSMTVENIVSVLCQSSGPFCREGAQHYVWRIPQLEGQLCRSECQMDSSGGGRCSGTSCCGSGSWSQCSPHPWISQSRYKKYVSKNVMYTMVLDTPHPPPLVHSW